MLLNEKRTTVAYRCPHCGGGIMSAVGLFNLSADMVKLKCTCGKSELKIVYNRDMETSRMPTAMTPAIPAVSEPLA